MTHWQPLTNLPDHLPAKFYAALTDTGSLTAYLSKGQQHFRVKLLQEKWQLCPLTESDILAISPSDYIKTREVHLLCDGIAQVYGYTLFPGSVIAQEPALSKLGENSLGDFLFKNSNWQRSEFEFLELTSEHKLFKQATYHLLPFFPLKLWARRSFFQSSKGRLLIYEVFLPSFFQALEE